MATSAKLTRLLNLLAALSETRVPLTAAELRRRLDGDGGGSDEAVRRAFERDKQALRDMGIELVVEEVPGADPPELGYRVARDAYSLRNPDLGSDEAAALHLAASLVRLDGVDGGAGLWKVAGPAGAGDAAPVLPAVEVPRTDHLGTCFAAVAERRSLALRYKGEDRLVDPYRLDFTRGHWYLSAFDHGRGDERVYRVDRIEGTPRPRGPVGAFERPETAVVGDRLQPWTLGTDPEVTARLLVDAAHAPIACSVLGPAAVVDERDDGSVVLELAVSHRDGFRSFVLGFLDHAEVLAPPELRDDLAGWLRGMAEAGAGAAS